ncbi:hypothetical protein PVAG01_05797 [Phlyctema vagabunda]|uniref:AB hydrolase-1 domain-containing protein n=1 Tax=Phlyctema vagabunda TaxID=108571 RepID=A0ABR4PF34_9HELO
MATSPVTTTTTTTTMTSDFLTLPNKPTAPISYTFIAPPSPSRWLIVFLNGLALPASSWEPVLALLAASGAAPGILTYDRFGQGRTTSLDPDDDEDEMEPGYGHGYLSVVSDLHGIIQWVRKTYYTTTPTARDETGGEGEEDEKLEILLVGASIGAVIARLYVQQHLLLHLQDQPFHHSVHISGLILLDSNIPHVDYSEILPDPGAAGINPADLVADDCTLAQYVEARTRAAQMFDLGVRNRERLDRRTGRALLPYANRPRFERRGGGVVLSVVGHDAAAFAEQGLVRMGTPKSVTLRFLQPYWEKYNAGLLNLSDELLDDEVVIATGCGHFIQVDDAAFVAQLVGRMMQRLGW